MRPGAASRCALANAIGAKAVKGTPSTLGLRTRCSGPGRSLWRSKRNSRARSPPTKARGSGPLPQEPTASRHSLRRATGSHRQRAPLRPVLQLRPLRHASRLLQRIVAMRERLDRWRSGHASLADRHSGNDMESPRDPPSSCPAPGRLCSGLPSVDIARPSSRLSRSRCPAPAHRALDALLPTISRSDRPCVCPTTGIQLRGPERSEGLVGFNGLRGLGSSLIVLQLPHIARILVAVPVPAIPRAFDCSSHLADASLEPLGHRCPLGGSDGRPCTNPTLPGRRFPSAFRRQGQRHLH